MSSRCTIRLPVFAVRRCFASGGSQDGAAEGFSLDLEEGDLKAEDVKAPRARPIKPAAADSHSTSGVAKRKPRENFEDVLDRRNPPRLTVEHYLMLRQARKELAEERQKENKGDLLQQMQGQAAVTEEDLQRVFGSNNDLPPVQLGRAGPDEEGVDQGRELLYLEALQQEAEYDSPARKRKPDCLFCKPDLSEHKINQLVYTNVDLLLRFVNERGMILHRKYSGCCAVHQRVLAKTIKQARVIGLLSFTSNWRVPEAFYTRQR